MKPIGYYLSTQVPQSVETIFNDLPYDAKIDIGKGIIDTAKHEAPLSRIMAPSPLELFVEGLASMERIRLGAALIMVAVDEYDQEESQKRRGNHG